MLFADFCLIRSGWRSYFGQILGLFLFLPLLVWRRIRCTIVRFFTDNRRPNRQTREPAGIISGGHTNWLLGQILLVEIPHHQISGTGDGYQMRVVAGQSFDSG
uniref:Uncharacterized protein n=1 Tax=Cacopsylla melanoneura TaxID=428564 RepID=A0A8D8VFC1_9HEMI